MAIFDEHAPLEDEVEEVHNKRRDASKHQSDWRKAARDSYSFVSGDQWSDEQKARLEELGRPCVTFNRVQPIVDSVVGYEINNRRETKYIPRTQADRHINEVFTAGAQWVRDDCDAEDEESDAFRDCVICGMGWMETRVDFESDPEGRIVMERVSPLEMRWDPAARKNNLADANWLVREKWWAIEDVKEMFPDADELIPGGDMLGDEEWLDEHDATNAWKYNEDQRGSWYDPKEGKVLLLHYQWREMEPYFAVADEQTGQIVEFEEGDKFQALKTLNPALEYVKRRRYRYHQRIICGRNVLHEGPAAIDSGFSFRCITGKRDEEHGYFVGLVEAMKDPQRWANTFFANAMHAMQSNAKGGLMAEQSAVGDKLREIEDSWASGDGLTIFEDGALTSGAVREKPFGGYPPSLDKLMQFSIQSIRDVTGVNLEMLGMVGHEQTGILEIERKKSALTILAPMMNSVKRYRKIQGADLLAFMRRYMTPQQLARIADSQQPIQFDDETVRYDVIVDDAPTSPNLKDEVWQSLQNILPAALRAGMPIPPDLIKFSPLPTGVADAWVQYVNEKTQQPDPQQVQEQMQQMQAQLQKLQDENLALRDKREAMTMQLQARVLEAGFDAKVKEKEMLLSERKWQTELVYQTRGDDADRLAKLLEIQARYDTEMERIESQAETQLKVSANQFRQQRDSQVFSLQAEREKRASERGEDMPEIGKTFRSLVDAIGDLQQKAQSGNETKAAVLTFMKQRGGSLGQLAKQVDK